jgi:hypothetical protein
MPFVFLLGFYSSGERESGRERERAVAAELLRSGLSVLERERGERGGARAVL